MRRIDFVLVAGILVHASSLAQAQLARSPLRVDVRDVTLRPPVARIGNSDEVAAIAPVAIAVTHKDGANVSFAIRPSAFGGQWLRVAVARRGDYDYYPKYNAGSRNEAVGDTCPTDPNAYTSSSTFATTPAAVCVLGTNPSAEFTGGRLPGQVDLQVQGAMPTSVTTENVISDARYLRLLSPNIGDEGTSLSGMPLTVSAEGPDSKRILIKVIDDLEISHERVGLQIRCTAPFLNGDCGWIVPQFETNPDRNDAYLGITTDTVTLQTYADRLRAQDQNLITVVFRSAAPYGAVDFVRLQMNVPNSDPTLAKTQSALFVDGGGYETETPFANGSNEETEFKGTLYMGESRGSAYNPAVSAGGAPSLARLAEGLDSSKQPAAVTKTSGRVAGGGAAAMRTGNASRSGAAAGWVDLSVGSPLRGVSFIRESGGMREAAVPLAKGAYRVFMLPFDNQSYTTYVSIANRGSNNTSCLISVRREGSSMAVSENGPTLGPNGSAPLFDTTQLASMRSSRGLATFTCTREVIAIGVRQDADYAISSYDVIVPSADTRTQAHRTIPLVLDGGRYSTSFMLVNTSTEPQPYQIFVYGGNIVFENERLRQGTIAPGSVVHVNTASADDYSRILWAEIRCSPAVQGNVVWRGRPDWVANTGSEGIGNLHAFSGRDLVFPFDETAGRETRLIFVNNSRRDANVRLTLRGEDGRILAQDQFRAPNGEQYYLTVAKYLGSGQKGTFDLTSDAPLTAIALRFTHIGNDIRTFTAFAPGTR